ncbi:WD-40 repeat-containing protein [Achlya hypogyna]|uniref:Coronin n=1 Tax=Achlya hypogyna TaxID=1202772 RepID=A0A1V9ZNZ9_ACHHY|nr:WD-40 repeat-containing protein [Achlya hypogyna]
MFRASKYRNLLGTSAPRGDWYEELQLDATRLDLYPLAASISHLAFPSQYNAGACVEVKSIDHVGKANALPTPARLLRGHNQRVNTVAFAPFDASTILASGGDDSLVKLWNLTSDGDDTCAWTSDAFSERVVSIEFHPSAKDVLLVATITGLHVVHLDTHATQPAASAHPAAITGATWNADGSLALTVCQDNMLRVWDPRAASVALEAAAHQGRKAASLVWGFESYCVTAGFNKLQERELFLWDVRSLGKPVGRERVDTGTGVLQPLVDADTKLLFLGGRGDRSVRAYEIQQKNPIFAPLQHTAVANPTWGLARMPKLRCDVFACEVDRVLSLGPQTIEPIVYTVPRKEGASVFQADLYPDTAAPTPALSAEQWRAGENAPPVISVGCRACTGTSGSDTLGRQWLDHTVERSIDDGTSGNNDDRNTDVGANGIDYHGSTDSVTVAWQASAGWGVVPDTVILPTPVEEVATTRELSEKAKRLGALQGHKLKYLTGRPAARSEAYVGVSADGAAFATNGVVWAASAPGTGGPVLVHPLAAKGKVTAPRTLSGHKAPVTDMEFAPFAPALLATASDDATINVWDTATDACVTTLAGHTKGVRCLSFHPTAANVVATGALDATVRLWDVETATARETIAKFDDAPFNVAFNADGSLFATVTRDKVLRIVDPRLNQTVAMACAHAGSKAQRVVWCTQQASPVVLTVGFSARSERQLSLWDARNLLDPLTTTTIDTSGSALLPLYDASSNVVYLVGRGDRTVLSYEIDTAQPALLPCSVFSFNGPSIAAAAMLPKAQCNVADVELARLLLLTSAATIEPASFYLPRADKLKAYFQDDVYGLVPSGTPSLRADDWFGGATAAPNVVSLQPPGMPKLSDKPPEAVVLPKVIDFQARKQRELQEKKERDDRFERLHALAYQPSLHANATQSTTDADSDDGWDD